MVRATFWVPPDSIQFFKALLFSTQAISKASYVTHFGVVHEI